MQFNFKNCYAGFVRPRKEHSLSIFFTWLLHFFLLIYQILIEIALCFVRYVTPTSVTAQRSDEAPRPWRYCHLAAYTTPHLSSDWMILKHTWGITEYKWTIKMCEDNCLNWIQNVLDLSWKDTSVKHMPHICLNLHAYIPVDLLGMRPVLYIGPPWNPHPLWLFDLDKCCLKISEEGADNRKPVSSSVFDLMCHDFLNGHTKCRYAQWCIPYICLVWFDLKCNTFCLKCCK